MKFNTKVKLLKAMLFGLVVALILFHKRINKMLTHLWGYGKVTFAKGITAFSNMRERIGRMRLYYLLNNNGLGENEVLFGNLSTKLLDMQEDKERVRRLLQQSPREILALRDSLQAKKETFKKHWTSYEKKQFKKWLKPILQQLNLYLGRREDSKEFNWGNDAGNRAVHRNTAIQSLWETCNSFMSFLNPPERQGVLYSNEPNEHRVGTVVQNLSPDSPRRDFGIGDKSMVLDNMVLPEATVGNSSNSQPLEVKTRLEDFEQRFKALEEENRKLSSSLLLYKQGLIELERENEEEVERNRKLREEYMEQGNKTLKLVYWPPRVR